MPRKITVNDDWSKVLDAPTVPKADDVGALAYSIRKATGWSHHVDDLEATCEEHEKRHRRGRSSRGFRMSKADTGTYFAIKAICWALDNNAHKRATVPAGWLDMRSDYIKGASIARRWPELAVVFPPRVRAIIAKWDYMTAISKDV